jgi:hypothetical protein
MLPLTQDFMADPAPDVYLWLTSLVHGSENAILWVSTFGRAGYFVKMVGRDEEAIRAYIRNRSGGSTNSNSGEGLAHD